MVILKSLRKEKSRIEFEETLQVLLPVKAMLEIIEDKADLQDITLLLYLIWFLANQMVFRRLTMAAMMVTLHCGDQFKSHKFHISSMEWNWRVTFKHPANQDQSLIA
jgi:hypothetical protein